MAEAHDSSPSEAPGGDTEESRAPSRERGVLRVILAVFLSLATAFVLSSTYQLWRAVYDPPPGIRGDSEEAHACRSGLEGLTKTLDTSFAAAAGRTEGDLALAFESGLGPGWTDLAPVESACQKTPGGEDALAALLRLRRAEEAHLRRQTGEIAPLRRLVRASTK